MDFQEQLEEVTDLIVENKLAEALARVNSIYKQVMKDSTNPVLHFQVLELKRQVYRLHPNLTLLFQLVEEGKKLGDQFETPLLTVDFLIRIAFAFRQRADDSNAAIIVRQAESILSTVSSSTPPALVLSRRRRQRPFRISSAGHPAFQTRRTHP